MSEITLVARSRISRVPMYMPMAYNLTVTGTANCAITGHINKNTIAHVPSSEFWVLNSTVLSPLASPLQND